MSEKQKILASCSAYWHSRCSSSDKAACDQTAAGLGKGSSDSLDYIRSNSYRRTESSKSESSLCLNNRQTSLRRCSTCTQQKAPRHGDQTSKMIRTSETLRVPSFFLLRVDRQRQLLLIRIIDTTVDTKRIGNIHTELHVVLRRPVEESRGSSKEVGAWSVQIQHQRSGQSQKH